MSKIEIGQAHNELFDLRDKVILVTGGASGIGRAIVKRLMECGSRVVVFDRSRDRLLELTSELGANRGKIATVEGDVTSPSDNLRAVSTALSTFGHLDAFVGNAGISDQRAKLQDTPIEKIGPAFKELFGVNVMGYMLGVKAALPELIKSKGCIVLTASISSLEAGFGGIFYTSSKHAVAGFAKQLAHELAPLGIRVNAVAPAYVATNLSGTTALGQGERVKLTNANNEKSTSRPVAQPDDIAGVYLMLLSEAISKTMTGIIVPVDNGTSVRGR